MKKLNIDIILKIVILLAISGFYFKLIISNEILLYVHPRIVPFVVFAMIFMFIIGLVLVTESLYKKKKKVRFKNYVIFIIPLSIIFLMESVTAKTEIKSNDINVTTSSNIISNNRNNRTVTGDQEKSTINNESEYEIYSGKTESGGEGTVNKKELDIKNNVINVNSKNFVFSLDEILGNSDKYEGKEIEITGFVYKDKNLKESEFIIGRFMMVCCAADLQIAGIRCESNKKELYNNDTWIKLKGKIKKDVYDGETDPIIIVEQVEKDSNPDTSYVYPF